MLRSRYRSRIRPTGRLASAAVAPLGRQQRQFAWPQAPDGRSMAALALPKAPRSVVPEIPLTDRNRMLEARLFFCGSLLNIHHFAPRGQVTLGDGHDANLLTISDGLPTPHFPLARFVGEDCWITLMDTMSGEVELAGHPISLSVFCKSTQVYRDVHRPGMYRFVLPTSGRLFFRWGGAAFALRFVGPARRLGRSSLPRADHYYLKVLIITAGIVAAAASSAHFLTWEAWNFDVRSQSAETHTFAYLDLSASASDP